MLIVPPIAFRRRRPASARRVNQILRVSHDTVTNRLLVIISGTLSQDMIFAGAIQGSADGTSWVSCTGGNFNTPPQAISGFAGSVSAKTQWRIVDPSAWVFEDGRPLVPPFGGAIF